MTANPSIPSIDDGFIPIVFVVDSSYTIPLAVAIRSILNHYRGDCFTLRFYVISIDLSSDQKDVIRSVVESYNHPCVPKPPQSLPTLAFIDSPTGSCPLSLKLKLSSLLPSSLSTVLYLDADILVRADIQILWKMTKQPTTLAAVIDVGKATKGYFNAGLLILNLDYIRTRNIEEKMLSYVEEQAEGLASFQLKEQDVLNKFFPDCQSLSVYWNAQGLGSYANFRVISSPNDVKDDTKLFTAEELRHLEQHAFLVHFTGSSKVSLCQFNHYCPLPVKPWSGMITDPNCSQLNPFVREWYAVLNSIPAYHGWLPSTDAIQTTLQKEMMHKVSQIKEQLDHVHKSIAVVNSESSDEHLAILLPITSKGVDLEKQLKQLKQLVNSLPATCTKFYLGLDDNDQQYSLAGGSAASRQALLSCFPEDTTVMEFPATSPPQILHIVRQLAKKAYNDNCFYYVLLGDDVTIRTPVEHIMPLLRFAFQSIATRCCAPFGFGCVAFHDETSLGFPTFPVITKVHMDIFEQAWCPVDFVNQDADPYLYELYRKYQAACFCPDLILRNEIGGADLVTPPTRYLKQHIHWQDELLAQGVQRIDDYFRDTSKGMVTLSKCIRLDIIVPSYRIQRDYLERIIELPIPPNCSTTVIIIIDNPDPISYQMQKEYEHKYGDKVRIRVNSENKGASFTRSRGLDESAADWILFLDDDVIPSPELLFVYAEEIARTGHRYTGYVGATKMPTMEQEDITKYAKGIQLVHLLHFWSDHVSSGRELAPWGITAQLLIRRTKQRFNEVFPKNGGGEDIDLCLRTCAQLQLPLKNLPQAQCCHPWWNNGYVLTSRFIGWAKGDSYLVDMYPQHCYRSCPNGLETMLFLVLGFVLLLFYWLFCGQHSVSIADVTWLCAAVLVVFCIDVLFELVSIMQSAEYHLPALKGLERMYCGLIGIWFYRFLGADVGHVLYPLCRGSVSHLCVRYDWWCGLYPQDVLNNKLRERCRFLCFLGGLFAVASLCYLSDVSVVVSSFSNRFVRCYLSSVSEHSCNVPYNT